MGKSVQRQRDPYFVWRGSLTNEAMQRMAMHGDLLGCPPVGYRNGRDGDRKTASIEPAGAALVHAAFELAASTDLTVRALARRMQERGMLSRSGKPVTYSALYAILTDPFYYGVIEFQGKRYAGNHQPIIDKMLFDQVQEKLHSRRRCIRKTPLLLLGCHANQQKGCDDSANQYPYGP